MNIRRTIFCCLLTLPLLPSLLFAQQIPHFIEKLTPEEGLTSNTVTDIAQDDRHFLWIATSDGLNRFDGTDVTQFYHHANTNSLPHNYIHCLQQLPGNRLAIGTEGGLSFYDGNTGTFQNFYYQSNNSLDPYNNAIIGLSVDADGDIWALSRNCIFIFDPTRRFKRMVRSDLTETRAAQTRVSFVQKVWPLSDGDVLLYMPGGWRLYSKKNGSIEDESGSARLRQLAFLHRLDTPAPASALPGFVSSRLFKVFDKYFLLLHGDSALLFDEYGREHNNCRFPFNRYPYVLWSQTVVPIDSSRMLCLFHNFGLSVLSVSWRKDGPVLDSLSPLFWGDQKYNTALRDHQDNWWLATAKAGLQKIVPARQCFTGAPLIEQASGRPTHYETISISQWGRQIWVSTYGDGFYRIDRNTGREQQYRLRNTGDDTWANFIWDVRQIDKDTLWVGTQKGLFWYCLPSHTNGRLPFYPGKPPALDQVAITTQFRDSHGLIWMGLGAGNGLCCFDSIQHRFSYYPGNNPQGYPLRYPVSIAEDRKGDLWLTSDASNSLVRWRRDADRFTVIRLPAAIPRHIGPLNSVGIEGDSVLWLSSLTCGLVRFNPSTGSLAVYGHENGLANSHIGGLFEDASGRIWLRTEGGLACFNPSTETFSNYTSANGLPATCLTADFFYDSPTGRLYNGGYGSYFYFHPNAISPDGRLPDPLITSVIVNGRPRMPASDSITNFASQDNDITIRYAAVDLTDGPSIRYAYRLMGADTERVMVDRQCQINFSHLPPGNYTFLVRAATGNGTWNLHPTGFSFRIYPSFTQTIAFYILLLLGIGSVAWSLYRYRLRQLHRAQQIRSDISRNLHDEVGANLTNISLSSLLAQQQLPNGSAVSQLLERIYQDSQQVSESMREIVWSIDPDIDTLGEALPRMVHYASGLLEARGIELEALVASGVEDLRLDMHQRRDLYLIFKEAVNNMARHSEASHAAIRFDLEGHALLMTVQDNGSGFDTVARGEHNGLRNMKERAHRHQWRLNISSCAPGGTTITLKT